MKKKTVSVQGLRFTGFEEDYVFQTIEKTQDFYESALLRQWSPLVPSPGTILDVGANLGNHTLFWSRFFPEAEIVSLEPLPENYECLCQNVTDNALSRVRPLRAAAGEKEGFVRVAGFNPENLGATSFQYSDSGDEQTAVVRTLDSVGEELRLSGIGLVKIDTEGFELSVLRGMEGILDRDRPVLWIECGPETVPGVLRILKGKAYLPIRLEGANLLFFPEEKSPEAELGTEQLLSVSLTLLDKVNRYFQNYETSKKWLESKDRQLSSVREQLSLCYYASSGFARSKRIMTVSSGIEVKDYDRALAEILHQLDLVRQGQWEPWELESARAAMESALTALSDSQGAMENYCLGQNALGLDETPEELLSALQSVTRERIMAAARAAHLDTVYFLKGKEETPC